MNKFNRQTDSKRIFTLFVKFTNRAVNISNGPPFFSFSISGLSFTFYFTHFLLVYSPFFSYHLIFSTIFYLLISRYCSMSLTLCMFICRLPIFTFENVMIGMSFHLPLSLVSSNYYYFARFPHLFSSYY